ncbi:MAG: alanyl-tRNA editing protein AlaXM [Chloroflexota bacterium]
MRATELLYLDDSYRTSFRARIVDVSEQNVVLDRTLFYPRGDGQMSDRGHLSVWGKQYPVLAVENRGGVVAHTVDRPLPSLGDPVEGHIDWDFRYAMMRAHSALHVVAGAIHRELGAAVTRSRLSPDCVRLELVRDDLSSEHIAAIERASNNVIDAGHPVRARLLSRSAASRMPDVVSTGASAGQATSETVRVVHIGNFYAQIDGGTHVANTLEIGNIRVTNVMRLDPTTHRLEIRLPPLH